MKDDTVTEDANAEVISSDLVKHMGATVIVNGDVKVDDHLLRAAQISEGSLTKQSIEFINGKRKVRLGVLGTLRRKKTFLRALAACNGVITDACKASGVDRRTVYFWLEKDVDFNNKLFEIEEIALDFGESQLHKNMAAGYEASTIFFLKTRGKKRGYIEQGDATGKTDLQKRIEESTDDELDEQIRALEAKINPTP